MTPSNVQERIKTMKKLLVATLALAVALVSMLPGLSAAGVNMQHNQTSLS